MDLYPQLEHYLKGGKQELLELFGDAPGAARDLAARRAAVGSVRRPARGMVAVDLLAGAGTCSRHLVRLGAEVRAMVEWDPTMRGVYRLCVEQVVPHVADYWGPGLKKVQAEDAVKDPTEAIVATPTCVTFSRARGRLPAGLNDPRGWMLALLPMRVAGFRFLLFLVIIVTHSTLICHTITQR